MFDGQVLAADVDDLLGEFVHADDLFGVSEVDRLAVGLLVHRPNHTLREVGDVDEAALLSAVAEEFDRIAVFRFDGLSAQRGDDVAAVRVEALSWTIAVEDTDRARVHIRVCMVGVTRDFTEDFGPPVGRMRVRRDGLVLGESIEVVVLLTIDTRARGEHEPVDVVDAGGFQHMLVHEDTRRESVNVLTLDVVDATDARREVEDVVDVFRRLDTALVGCEVDRVDFDLVL